MASSRLMVRPRAQVMVDLRVGEEPSRGISRVLGLPPESLHGEGAADGLPKARGGAGHHDRLFGPSKRDRRLPQAVKIHGRAGQVSEPVGDLEALPKLILGLLVASLQQGGQPKGPQDLALVPSHPERAGAGKALFPVGAGAVEVSGEQPQQL
jgi:hypothetical protein